MPDAEISSFLVAILQFKFLFPTAYTVAKMTITFLFATQAKIFLTKKTLKIGYYCLCVYLGCESANVSC